MLSGIPEVDLGLEAKIRNIEATEETKQKLLRDSLRQKDKPSEFVPKNMAVNFVQHNRCELNTELRRPSKPILENCKNNNRGTIFLIIRNSCL